METFSLSPGQSDQMGGFLLHEFDVLCYEKTTIWLHCFWAESNADHSLVTLLLGGESSTVEGMYVGWSRKPLPPPLLLLVRRGSVEIQQILEGGSRKSSSSALRLFKRRESRQAAATSPGRRKKRTEGVDTEYPKIRVFLESTRCVRSSSTRKYVYVFLGQHSP